MLVDVASSIFSAGHGGGGKVSFGKSAHAGPDGGNGGKGGDIYLRATSDITLLNQFTIEEFFKAKDGLPGRQLRQSGKNGEDLELLVPRGTNVIDEETGEPLFELNEIDQKELLCVGGKGGKGNYEFRSSTRTTPEFAQPGLPGEKKHIKLILKLIADYGLVGLPNAGKSSLINEITNAKAKVGDYAFTTLSPNLGMLNGKTVADIPGLIEGASMNKGLGVGFLKHIEKVKVILHCIAADTENPLKAYETVRREMGLYSSRLLSKKEIIVITKTDLVDKDALAKIKKEFTKDKKKVIAVSIHDWEAIEKLKKIVV